MGDKLKKGREYFDLKRTLSHNCKVNLITSDRGYGKTAASLSFAAEVAREGWEFIYLRDTNETLKLVKDNIFSVCEEIGTASAGEFKCDGDKYYRIVNNKPILCGHAMAINLAAKYKGTNYHKVKVIVHDEFINEHGEYVPREFQKFLSIVSTVLRRRDALLIMLANCASNYNPYYVGWGVKPDPNKEFTKIPERDMLIQTADSSVYRERVKESLAYKLLKGTEYGEFALESRAILDPTDYVETIKGAKVVDYHIIIDGSLHRVSRFSSNDLGVCVYMETRKSPDAGLRVINLDNALRQGSIRVVKSHPVVKRLKTFANMGKVFFSDPAAKQKFDGIL